MSKDDIVEEKAAEPLSLARNALFTDDRQPTSTIADSVITESVGSAYDRISIEPSSSKKKPIKIKKEKKAKKSSVPIPDFDEPAADAGKSIDAPIDATVEARGEQLATEPVERELEAGNSTETPMETAVEARGEQPVLEPTPLNDEPFVIVPAELTVKPEQPVTAEPSISVENEVTPSASKKKAKKGKKSKKAELESTEVETAAQTMPVASSAERSLDAPTSESVPAIKDVPVNEPVSTEAVQEKVVPLETEAAELILEPTPTIEDVTRQEPSLPQNVATATEREIPAEPMPFVQEDAPKTKKSKKSKRKSGVSTPQQELVTATEPSSSTPSEPVVEGEASSGQPIVAQNIVQPIAVEAADIPLPAEHPDEDLTQPIAAEPADIPLPLGQSDEDLTQPPEKETLKDVSIELEPTRELSSAPVEAELPVTPKGKKSKRESGTATLQPELEVAPEQASAPIDTSAPISEPVATLEEAVDQSRDIEQPSTTDPADVVHTTTPEQKLDDVTDPATVPLPVDSFNENLSTPLEQLKPADSVTTPVEPIAEVTPSTPTSKKDKKKKGKKSKVVEVPVEEMTKQEQEGAEVGPSVMEESKMREVVQEEERVGVEMPVGERDEIRDVDSKATDTENASIVPQEQSQPDVMDEQAATKEVSERADETSEPAKPTHLEHQSEVPVVTADDASISKPSQPVDRTVDDIAEAATSSKTDKKKKKNKKAKATTEEPSTPVLEEQRELEILPTEPAIASSELAPEQSTQGAVRWEQTWRMSNLPPRAQCLSSLSSQLRTIWFLNKWLQPKNCHSLLRRWKRNLQRHRRSRRRRRPRRADPSRPNLPRQSSPRLNFLLKPPDLRLL
jgi:hypothetical protein